MTTEDLIAELKERTIGRGKERAAAMVGRGLTFVRNLWKSVVRHGYPLDDRNRSEVVFWNFFLHIQPVKV